MILAVSGVDANDEQRTHGPWMLKRDQRPIYRQQEKTRQNQKFIFILYQHILLTIEQLVECIVFISKSDTHNWKTKSQFGQWLNLIIL